MKSLSRLVILNIIVCSFVLGDYVRYNACDPKWADIPLWANSLSSFSDTICHKELPESYEVMNGWLLTSLSDLLATQGRGCGSGDICNPESLNKVMSEHMMIVDEVYEILGMEDAGFTFKLSDIQKVLDNDNIAIGSTKPLSDGIIYAFAVKSVNQTHVFGIDNFGKDQIYHEDSIEKFWTFIMKKLKFLEE